MTSELPTHVSNSSEAQLLARVPAASLIGGEWRERGEGEPIAVEDPATGSTLLELPNATVADGLEALDAAAGAQLAWAQTPARQRAELLRAAFEATISRREEFALLMTLEMGKPLAESKGEVTYGGEFLRWFSEEAVRISRALRFEPRGNRTDDHHAPARWAVILITPWNFPLAMATRKIAPAIAAGCTAIIKPAALTPLTTLYFAKLLQDAGLPAGVLGVLTSSKSAEASAPIIGDSRLRKLSFTGSTPVGGCCSSRRPTTCCAPRWSSAETRRYRVSRMPISTRPSTGRCSPSSATSARRARRPTVSTCRTASPTPFSSATRANAGVRVGRGTEDVELGPMIDEAVIRASIARRRCQ